MEKNLFFKPTPLYKEFMILDLVAKNPEVTQRKVADILNISVSMVNYYLEEYETKGFIKKTYINSKNVHYIITKVGVERRKVLNIGYLNATIQVHNAAKSNIISFLNYVVNQHYKLIILYGAGEVTESMLQVMQNDKEMHLKPVAIIDDDVHKQGSLLVNTPIISIKDIYRIKHDGVLISSYANHQVMYKKLMDIDYPKDQIISFFED